MDTKILHKKPLQSKKFIAFILSIILFFLFSFVYLFISKFPDWKVLAVVGGFLLCSTTVYTLCQTPSDVALILKSVNKSE